MGVAFGSRTITMSDMLHALCFLSSFVCAVYGANQIHTDGRPHAQYILVGGLLLLCLIITLDYITEQVQKKSRARRFPVRRFYKATSKQH